MAAPTYQEMLENALNAVNQIYLYGQVVSSEGDALTRADLPRLEESIERLQAKVDAQAGKSIFDRRLTGIIRR